MSAAVRAAPVLAVTGLLLAGCVAQTPQQQAAYGRQQMAAMQQQLTIDDMRCSSYGAPRGSQIYVQCRAQADALHRQMETQRMYQQRTQPSLLSPFMSGGGYGYGGGSGGLW